jgi:ankyrin repeat protein
MRLLVDYGADVNARNNDGNTFVHAALENNNINWLSLVRSPGNSPALFESMVDLSIKNNKGYDSYAYAQYIHTSVYDPVKTDLNTRWQKKPIIVGLDASGKVVPDKVNARDALGYTALMLAIMRGDQKPHKNCSTEAPHCRIPLSHWHRPRCILLLCNKNLPWCGLFCKKPLKLTW